MDKIGIVGFGNLGSSIGKGLLKVDEKQLIVASKRDVSDSDIATSKGISLISDNVCLLEKSDLILITLKPFTILDYLTTHKEHLDPKRHVLISAASSISIKEIENVVGEEFKIARVMPNTASEINESMTLIALNENASIEKDRITKVMSSVGEVLIIDENLMEAATILGACGVAYVLRFMRAMIQGGIEVGFDAKTASKIVAQTMKGAAELVIKNESHPEAEIDKVTTPKGCTIVGLNEMEHAGFSSALIKGIVASYSKISTNE